MIVLHGNVIVTRDGLKLATEISAGNHALGYDRQRQLAFATVVSAQMSADRDGFLIVSSSGEAIYPASASVSTLAGPRSVIELARMPDKANVRVERLPLLEDAQPADCALQGCVSRMITMLCTATDLSEIKIRYRNAISKAALDKVQLRNGTISAYEFYLSDIDEDTTVGRKALFHAGHCIGYDLLNAFSSDGRIPIQFSVARQCWLLYLRSQNIIPSLVVDRTFAPSFVSLRPSNNRKLDRLQGTQYLGTIASVDLRFDQKQFSPIVGSLPNL